ncbi:MAG: hypothetical protein IPK03_10345 [Bacteroidetes bacterium]|nr:hypothetical protein [Bacteroidota bacterium]
MTQENRRAFIRLTNVSFPSAMDTSDAKFNILPPVYVSSLNSITTLAACSNLNLNWIRTSNANYNNYSSSDATSSYRGKYELYYKLDNGTWINFFTDENYQTTTSYSYPLQVPDNPGSTIKLMVIAKYNTQTYGSPAPVFWVDSSNAYANIVSPTGSITVLTPNGGVNINGNSNYNITWSASGSSGFYDIQYSPNGGASFATIAANVSGTSYNWAVPNMNNSNIIIRVRDNQNICRKDNSDATNTIIPVTPVLTSPNGGEVWNVGTNQNITWTASTIYSSALLEFSTDNGSNWSTIANVSNTGTYAWTIPNSLSTQCLIRISNNGNPTLNDVSNAVFTINLPKPIITYPNGGEIVQSNETENITWNTTTVSSGVNLEYSSDSGATWFQIVSNYANTGSYPWSVPTTFENKTFLIRLTNFSYPSSSDTSNAVFTVIPRIWVSTLNTTANYTACNAVNISWLRSNNTAFNNYNNTNTYPNFYEIYSSVNGGAWNYIATEYSYINTYSYSTSYTLPDIAPATIKFLVIAKYNTSIYGVVAPYWSDSSNAIANVVSPTGTITVTSPNGGVNLNALTTHNITWTASGTSGFFDVQYSTNGGASFSTIVSNINGNSYTWSVPNLNSNNVIIRVRDNQNNCKKDVSNSANTIVPATPVLTSPNGGEVWNVNSSRNITWTAATLYTSVVIEFSIDNGTTWNFVSAATGNTGSFAWTVPFNPSTQCKIRISNFGNPSVFDVSDANFTIQIPSPVLLTPNGGETWYAGTSNAITWTPSTVFSTTVNLEYSIDNGLNWSTIANNVNNTGTYNWTIPNVNSTSALVRISNSANTAFFDVSNALFTLRPYVRITTPNGGNLLGSCTQTSIGFERSPFYTNYNIEYSIDNGSNWLSLQTNTVYSSTFNNYNWSIPNTSSTQARVRVYPTGVIPNGDQSDAVFVIKRAVTIIQPNFGGVLVVGSTYPIKWSSDGISNFYDLAYSTTGPTGPWTNIVLNYNTSTNNYNWTVPNAPSTNCYIRVRDNLNTCKEDISDVAFSISTSANPITVTAPNGTDSLSACSNYNITWTEVGGPIGTYNISYSIDNGVNYIPIVSNYATTSYSYSWTVPNISSSSTLVRVQSAPNPTLFDISNALFTILPGKVKTNNDTTICLGASVQINTTGGSTYVWTPTTGLSSSTIANPVATPTATTMYIVSSTNGSCSLSDTLNITVVNGGSLSASVSISPSPGTAICAGSVLTLTATPNNGGTNPSYQWKKNGTNTGVNAPTLITSTAATSDVFSCIMTSNLLCVSNNPATSNNVTMTVFPAVTPSVTISTPFTTICSGANVTFTASPTNGGGAPSYQWKKNNTNIGTNSNTFSSSTLSNNDVISLEMTSNANCAAPLIVSSNALLMTVNPNSTPSISISASTTSICTGSNVNFTANASNAGASPTYQWKINGTNVGTNSPTFSTTSLANNDNVTCDVTSSATCNTISTVSSNAIQISVSSSVTPSVSISPSTNNICAGTMVTFTATPTNGGSTPTYQWKVNNINAGTNSSTFASSSLNNGDSVKCVMTSNFGCASPSSGTSSSVGMLVNPTTPPTVSISSTSSTICAGTNVTFTANPTNGGASPSYQWKLNGNNVGGNASTYNSSALANNDSVWVIITSSSSCASPNNYTSNKLVTTVNPVATPSISISAASSNICAGTSVLFTATPSNGGSSPIYQWKINGTNVGTNSTTYSSSTLANNDVITCALTSNIACATSANAISSGILMTVTSNSVPTISISTATTTICSGTAVTFNSSITNGGGSPAFQWKLNGSNISLANASSYTTSGLANSDAISCVLTSNALCATPNTAASNSVNMTVNTSVTPSISISASSMSICAGNSITLTAVPTNDGTTPTYQWKKNGTNVGTNSPTYITSSLSNLDNIVCDMTSNALCATTTNVSSNSLVIGVNTTVTPSVSITVSSNNICAGTSVTFTASPTNGGASPVYTWKKNGTVISGATNSTYNSTSLANNDIITCELTSNAPCASPAIAASNPIQMVVSPALTPSVSITATTTTICGGTNVKFTASPTNGGTTPIYQWKVNGSNVGINADTFSSTTLANGDAVTCNMTTSLTCVTTAIGASNTITMTVNSSNSPSLTISTPSISICSGASITFTANPTNPGSSPSYQWKLNGSNVGTNSLTYINSSLNNSDTVSCVLTNTNLCAASNTAISNKIGMTVNSTNSPTVSISSNVGTTICSGASVTYTATPSNGGPSPSYQWKVNGTNVGTNSTSFATSSLNNGDVVTCIISIVNPCAASTNGTSNAIAMSVNSSASPTVSIAATATTVCSGTSITFTPTPTNPGSSPTYQWKVNGTNVGTNSNTFASSTLLNGDSVQCVFSNSNLCATSNMAFSNKLGLTVNSSASPSITISAPSTNICAGSNLTFTAVPTNPGSSPTYQWKINGTNVGTNSTTYSSSTLSNGDVVTCNINVINACAATTNAASNAINMTVNSNASPSVSIAASSTNICAGANVSFTATPSNGGVSPTFQWKVNGSNVGTNSTTFASSSINHLDTITCVISNSNICATSNVGISNKIGMTVNSTSSPSISISAPTTSICAGSNLTFTAVPTNGGSSPNYQWKINGSNVGTNSTTFSSSSLINGDVVTCNISILNACASSTNASSNALAITVNSTASPSISISASNANICVGANVTFTATPSNGGSSPSYQWKVNGSNVGTNSTTFASNALSNLDTITCVISNTNICASSNSGVSNKIGMNVNSSSSPTISISAPTTNICAGSNVVFTAVPTNGGNAPSYQWKVNGSNVGTNSATFATSTLSHGDVVTCNISIINPCAASTTASSNAINMTVNSTSNPTVSISASNTTICAGSNVTFTATPSNGGASPSYQWKVNGVNAGTNSSTFASSSLSNSDTITCVISNTNPCATNNNGISNKIGMIVNPTANPSITISASSLNICAGANINFTATPTNGGINPSYQWKVNGSNVGTNSNTYSSSSLNHGDIVTCFITTSNICSVLNTANSNSLNISVNPTASPSLSISASSLNICAGTNVTFTANPLLMEAQRQLINGN